MSNINKIRPIEMHNKALLLREKSGIEFYLNEKNTFVDSDCPACLNKDNSEIVFYKNGFTHRKCKKCDTLYVSPRPPEHKLFEYYDKSEAINFWTDLLIKTHNERKYLQHIPRIEILETIIEQSDNQKKLFVELGSGSGNFSKAIQEANIFDKVLATDISDKCIKSCQKQSLETKKCTIKDFSNESIDCIALNDLIEHVFNPFEFLDLCFSKLKQNGILMLSTPNGEGFDFKILKDKTENVTPPEHLQYFNPKSIHILLRKIGFEIIDISTPGILDISIIKRQIIEKQFDIKQNNDFLDFILSKNDEELENSFQKFIQENKLSSHMLVFTRKIK
jgi:2-polyprenyl-3-methyl-5-hydroxy-6-metoxy-1,4-benzoquinol methylase